MKKGRVKWFNENKGYGYIKCDKVADVYVHFSKIEGEGFRTLEAGQDVEFEIEESEKGPQAVIVLRK